MTEISQTIDNDTLIEAATEAAHNANATLMRSLGVSTSDAPFWHDEQDNIKALKREVTKDVLGLPNTLTAKDNVNVGHIGLYVGIVRNFPLCYGLGVVAQLPQPVWTPSVIDPEPVTADPATSEAPTDDTTARLDGLFDSVVATNARIDAIVEADGVAQAAVEGQPGWPLTPAEQLVNSGAVEGQVVQTSPIPEVAQASVNQDKTNDAGQPAGTNGQ